MTLYAIYTEPSDPGFGETINYCTVNVDLVWVLGTLSYPSETELTSVILEWCHFLMRCNPLIN
jgi:hypothetical protein